MLMLLYVGNHRPENCDILAHQPYGGVAVAAKQRSDDSGAVAVIYYEFPSLPPATWVISSTNSAAALLFSFHLAVLRKCEAVLLQIKRGLLFGVTFGILLSPSPLPSSVTAPPGYALASFAVKTSAAKRLELMTALLTWLRCNESILPVLCSAKHCYPPLDRESGPERAPALTTLSCRGQ